MAFRSSRTTIRNVATGPSNRDTAHHANPLRPLPCASPALMSESVNQPTAYWVGMAPIWIAAIMVFIVGHSGAAESEWASPHPESLAMRDPQHLAAVAAVIQEPHAQDRLHPARGDLLNPFTAMRADRRSRETLPDSDLHVRHARIWRSEVRGATTAGGRGWNEGCLLQPVRAK